MCLVVAPGSALYSKGVARRGEKERPGAMPGYGCADELGTVRSSKLISVSRGGWLRCCRYGYCCTAAGGDRSPCRGCEVAAEQRKDRANSPASRSSCAGPYTRAAKHVVLRHQRTEDCFAQRFVGLRDNVLTERMVVAMGNSGVGPRACATTLC